MVPQLGSRVINLLPYVAGIVSRISALGLSFVLISLRPYLFSKTGIYNYQARASYLSNSGPVHTALEEFENGDFSLKTHEMFTVDRTTSEEFENEGFTLKTHQMFSVHTTLEEFENGSFTLKTHQMFSFHTTGRRNLKTEVSL